MVGGINIIKNEKKPGDFKRKSGWYICLFANI